MNFTIKKMAKLLSFTGMLGLSSYATAAGFQLWEQDALSVGNYHAGYAALANDASTVFYNPAGITRIQNQQIVFGANGVFPDVKYTGNVKVATTFAPTVYGVNQNVTAQGGSFNLLPLFHYVAPLTDYLGFGLSVAVPFGLETRYGSNTVLRYATTTTATQVVNITPALGVKLNEKISLGAGWDIQKMSSEFDQVGTLAGNLDTDGTNKGFDTAYGYHLGALYQFNPNSRVGVSYHSSVDHDLRGTSNFAGPLANIYNNGEAIVSRVSAAITLPAYTALSGYHHFRDSKWALMGSALYTQWNVIRNLTLKNVAGIDATGNPSVDINVTVPEHYQNTWNLALGTDYYLNDTVTLRGGLGFDQSPVQNAYRNVQLPDANRFAIAFGGHYQTTKHLGLDFGWTHIFVPDASIHPPPLVTGMQVVTTEGKSSAGADVLGVQLVWDIV